MFVNNTVHTVWPMVKEARNDLKQRFSNRLFALTEATGFGPVFKKNLR